MGKFTVKIYLRCHTLINLKSEKTPAARREKPWLCPDDSYSIRRVNLLAKLQTLFAAKPKPEHLRRGELGERAAEKHLRSRGLKFLARNYRSARGEVDLVFQDGDCLAFVEVKTRSSETWTRPAAAVDARKRRLLSQTALDYLRAIKNPPVKIRFDIVEVLLTDGGVREIRHLPNTFPMSKPYRYG